VGEAQRYHDPAAEHSGRVLLACAEMYVGTRQSQRVCECKVELVGEVVSKEWACLGRRSRVVLSNARWLGRGGSLDPTSEGFHCRPLREHPSLPVV